jgi:hypothetical protein
MKKKLADVKEDLELTRFLIPIPSKQVTQKGIKELTDALEGIKRGFERDIAAFEVAQKARDNIYKPFGGGKGSRKPKTRRRNRGSNKNIRRTIRKRQT